MGVDRHELAKSVRQYLIKLSGPGHTKSAAHVWFANRDDTSCKMWSSGGIGVKSQRKHFAVTNSKEGRRVCHMCQVNLAKEIAVENVDTVVGDTNP